MFYGWGVGARNGGQVAHLGPSAALAAAERALRSLLAVVLVDHYGAEGWLGQVASAERIAKWTELAETETRTRGARGVAVTSTDPLDYAQLYELVDLAKRHWSLVAPALGNKAVTGALLDRLDDLRNTVAHNREVLPFEEDLLAGIAGEIRNRVTIYMSSKDPSGDYYPRVESITDGLGNILDGQKTLSSENPHVLTEQTLRVGDVVTFDCRASDPQGRTITWRLTVYPGLTTGGPSVEGENARLEWLVTGDSVGESISVQIRMTSSGPYHRWAPGHDGFGAFVYRVIPPNP